MWAPWAAVCSAPSKKAAQMGPSAQGSLQCQMERSAVKMRLDQPYRTSLRRCTSSKITKWRLSWSGLQRTQMGWPHSQTRSIGPNTDPHVLCTPWEAPTVFKTSWKSWPIVWLRSMDCSASQGTSGAGWPWSKMETAKSMFWDGGPPWSCKKGDSAMSHHATAIGRECRRTRWRRSKSVHK